VAVILNIFIIAVLKFIFSYPFDISFCTQSSLCDDIFKYLTNLLSLDMSSCTQFTDHAFSYLPNLSTLHITSSTLFTDHAFSSLTNLRSLNYHNYPYTTDNTSYK